MPRPAAPGPCRAHRLRRHGRRLAHHAPARPGGIGAVAGRGAAIEKAGIEPAESTTSTRTPRRRPKATRPSCRRSGRSSATTRPSSDHGQQVDARAHAGRRRRDRGDRHDPRLRDGCVPPTINLARPRRAGRRPRPHPDQRGGPRRSGRRSRTRSGSGARTRRCCSGGGTDDTPPTATGEEPMPDPVRGRWPAVARRGWPGGRRRGLTLDASRDDGPTVLGDDGAAADPVPAPVLAGADASLLALIDRLTRVLERSDLGELEIAAGGTTIVLRPRRSWAAGRFARAGGRSVGAARPPTARRRPPQPAAAAVAPAARPSVKAPLTGFYTAPRRPARPHTSPWATRSPSARSSASSRR